MRDDHRLPKGSERILEDVRMPSRVALVRGDDRRRNISQALKLIDDQIRRGKRIVIKPNLVSITKPLSATHADALEVVLQFVRKRTDAEIKVAEGCAIANAMKGSRLTGSRRWPGVMGRGWWTSIVTGGSA